MTKVSIIVPVFNRENFIKDCIDSLLDQTLEDYEIIIVDDGSTDQTPCILEKINNPKVRVFLNSRNRGPSFSRNRGMDEAVGKIFILTDSDCIVKPNWLEEIIKPFADNYDIVITGGKIIDPDPTNYWEFVNKGTNRIACRSGFVKNVVGCNMGMRAEFAQEHPFDERIRFPGGEELDLVMQAYREDKKVYYTDKALVIHHHRMSLKCTFWQQFYYGYGNGMVSFKNKQIEFAYAYYFIWMVILIVSILLLNIWQVLTLPLFFGMVAAIYLGMVFYASLRTTEKSLFGHILSFPGYLIISFSHSLGKLYFLWECFVLRKVASRR